MCQESAITRFLADDLNLAGNNAYEKAELDSLYSLWFSTMRNNGVSHDGEHFSIASLKESSALNIIPSKYHETFRINNLNKAERSLMILDYFEKQLAKVNTGYLLLNKPSYVDLGLFYILYELNEDDNVPDFATKFNFPLLGEFLNRIANRNNIQKYLKSPSRMPRYARQASGLSLYTYVEGNNSPKIN